MENGTVLKVALAILVVLALCIIVGAVLPGNPLKAMVDQAAGSLNAKMPGAPTAAASRPTDFPIDPASQASASIGISKAIEVAGTDNAAASWLSEHKSRRLNRAETGHMDTGGVASEWSLTYIDGQYVMIVEVRNDRVISCNAYKSSAATMYGIDPSDIVDSAVIMKNLMAGCPGLMVTKGSMPFSMTLDAGDTPTYKVSFTGEGSQPGFSATFNARTGEMIENSYRSVTG